MISLIQVAASIFCFFMLYHVYLNFKKRNFGKYGLFLWASIWGILAFISLFPEIFYIGNFFKLLGIARALDFFTIFGFLFVLSFIFYLYKNQKRIEKRQKKIVKEIALKSGNRKK